MADQVNDPSPFDEAYMNSFLMEICNICKASGPASESEATRLDTCFRRLLNTRTVPNADTEGVRIATLLWEQTKLLDRDDRDLCQRVIPQVLDGCWRFADVGADIGREPELGLGGGWGGIALFWKTMMENLGEPDDRLKVTLFPHKEKRVSR